MSARMMMGRSAVKVDRERLYAKPMVMEREYTHKEAL